MNTVDNDGILTEEYISAATLADVLGLSGYQIVVKDIKRGMLPAVWEQNMWCIRKEDAREYSLLRKKMSVSISARELSSRTDMGDQTIGRYIHKGSLPAFRPNGFRQWYILEKDAREFCQSMGWTYFIKDTERLSSEKDVIKDIEGLSHGRKQNVTLDTQGNGQVDIHRCSACGVSKGNLVGDVDKILGKRYGLLCMRCYSIVRDFGGDINRIRLVVTYLVNTRNDPV